MNRRNITSFAKNAMGTVFLLAGAFFVCSTFLSMRAVFADPIAPTATPVTATGSASRVNVAGRSAARTNAASRARTTTNTASRGTTETASRNVVSRGVASRANATTTRNVVARNTANRSTTRNVVARTTTNPSRVSLTGSAIRGNKNSAATTTYTYLTNRLYTGNYSNIIDSTTGLISAEAYQNCLESYYTCMDEVCTARSAAQGRCACAARVKSFIEAENALETANEELIKASGELALLIANKGKDVSAAFQLTDAEKVMNCVSWQETTSKYGVSSQQAIDWCSSHSIYGSSGGEVTSCSKPSYCSETGNDFGFDIANIEGSSSDILATLQAWADSKDSTIKLLTEDDDNLLSSFTNVSNIVSGLTSSSSSTTDTTLDSLANTWGYELFQYAHNNVCGRVLDSCFNGIYEGCGTPPSVSVKGANGTVKANLCANGATSNCPFNYNSKVAISSTGDVTLNERGSTNATTSSSAACFGYSTTTTTSGTTTTSDPYSTLRGPVADARRSVMQKYLLDANAACDVYGDALRTTAQNIGYQKIAAQQALQQKRLEFENEEKETILSEAIAAGTNFDECLSEIYDCYETQASNTTASGAKWTDARIKTYCAQIANVPHCYETMICNPSTAQFHAIIDKQDSASCLNSQDYTKNTCRNIVTLNEIINKAADNATLISAEGTGNSAEFREKCLQDAGVEAIRNWTRPE